MQLFGIIGYPLGHSFSPAYFTSKFAAENVLNASYKAFPIDSINKLLPLIENQPELIGLNVTIPYKEQVIPLLHKLDETAKAVGAVNTIYINRQHTVPELTGFNTDVWGFEHSLCPLLTKDHKKALILGTGGAAKAVAYVLDKLHIAYQYVSRNPQGTNTISYNQLNANIIDTHKLIINTSPLGMYPNIETCPDIPYALLSNKHLLYDLIYNPAETMFMQQGVKAGAKVKNGHEMLILQAEHSWAIWNNK